jgi:hypothetical protein
VSGVGFKSLFRDTRDIHELIFEIAEHHRTSDMEALYRRLPGLRLFAPVQAPDHLRVGRPSRTARRVSGSAC